MTTEREPESGTEITDSGNASTQVNEQASDKASSPKTAVSAASEGLLLQRDGDLEGAIAAFTEAIEINPKYIGAYYSRADAYQKLGREEEAKADRDFIASNTRQVRQSIDQQTMRDVRYRPNDDTVGVGYYILAFILAGFIGLGVQYFMRRKGWAATGVNAAIFVIAMIVLAVGG